MKVNRITIELNQRFQIAMSDTTFVCAYVKDKYS